MRFCVLCFTVFPFVCVCSAGSSKLHTNTKDTLWIPSWQLQGLSGNFSGHRCAQARINFIERGTQNSKALCNESLKTEGEWKDQENGGAHAQSSFVWCRGIACRWDANSCQVLQESWGLMWPLTTWLNSSLVKYTELSSKSVCYKRRVGKKERKEPERDFGPS